MVAIVDSLERDASLSQYCTLRIGERAAYLAHISSSDQLVEAHRWAKAKGLPVLVLGEGSNVIFSDQPFKGLVLRMEIPGFEAIKRDQDNVWIKLGAGENWDQTVKRVVDMGLSGIEAMSLIPGTAGATPVQNVGAYGQEIKDTLETVEAYDTHQDKMVELTNADCGFAYRDSIFKSAKRGRYIICTITLKLSTAAPAAPTYASLKKYLEEQGTNHPTLPQIRQAVMAVRLCKLPDPRQYPNVGSFFKNPIISADQLTELQAKFPNINYHQLPDGRVKLAAGWLMEQSGLKGWKYKNLGTYELNALVVVNYGQSSYKDLMELKAHVTKTVKDKFGIILVQEPQVLFE
ncbi:MAG TPA: UDP-N-acetylmuramate dehydrogenase [Candidatus Saccharimonadales bacterium]|nr:UDP-N-acetylmuramate dehydrogenase [Candidatus Saccharimonadales bacterium]